jgi:hypothetical protein
MGFLFSNRGPRLLGNGLSSLTFDLGVGSGRAGQVLGKSVVRP